MKSSQERDAVVEAAARTLEGFPTFADLPETKVDGIDIPTLRPDDPGLYAAAVYEAVSRGTIQGRRGNSIIVSGRR
jgi:hypothetical protein